MRIICIAVFLTIGCFKSGETASTSSVTSTTDSISENTTPSYSESTISSSSDNIISTESSTVSLPSTTTDESTMSSSTEEVTSGSGTTGSSTTVSTPLVQDTSIDTTITTNETIETTTTDLDSSFTSTADLSTTEEQTTNVTDISNTSTGSTHSRTTTTTDLETTDNNTTDLTTETQATSTTEYNSVSTESIYSTTTEEETTDDETSSTSESTVNGTSSESSIYTSTSTEERTSTPRTTTAPPTSTTHISIDQTIHVDTANAIMAVSVNVTFTSCVSEQEASQNMSNALSHLDGFKSVIIDTSKSKICRTGSKRTGERSIKGSTFKVFLLAQILVNNPENITEEINSTVNSISNVQSSVALMQSYDICDSDVCQDAVLKHKGFNCVDDKGNCSLTSPCKSFVCKNEGTCTVQANGTHYESICKCKEDDMHSYSGMTCDKKSISWKLWTIIAAGAGGGIIVILLFAVVIVCAKRKSASPKTEVYGYDMGYDDRENLMYEPYLSSNEYHRKPLSKDERMEQTNLQTFDNHGYEQWDPSESKDTYASMDKHFQSPSFQTQITRPKIKANKHNDDQLTPF